MAILSSTGVSGFLSSAKATGKQILNKAGKLIPEYIEDFVSGFAGHGWKIWERVSGIWRIETDELVVRRTMIVFEMLISKIRCIKGALNISQGNGKIKTAELKEDGNWYITIEDEMSFVAHDIIRCQHFSNMAKFYWVEITDIINDNTTLIIPATEFMGSLEYKDGIEYVGGSGEMNIPEPGDEIIQFGNRVNKDRQSAIYLHADEGGQPAIDILFNINSKSFEGCLNMRMGGSIPGEVDMKGFYCENGMIKGTVNKHVVYQIKPDGSAMFGDGSAQFNADKSGYIAGGTISWEWDESKGKYVCTMQDVVLTWDNLSDEAKENLKGDKGEDAVFYLIEFNEDGNTVQSISAIADGVPKGKSLKASLYKITSGKKELCGARRFTISAGSQIWEVIPPMGGGPLHTISIDYGDSSIQSYTVAAYDDVNTVIALATIHKVLDGQQGEQGNPGADANLLPWIEKWNGYATELGGDYIVTPKMFSGKVETDENGTRLLTGIAQGKDCITASDGTTRTGIFALVDNEPVFELDPINKKYKFKGRVDADEGVFKGKVELAEGKILLNEDGSGQLAAGTIQWDKEGNLIDSGKLITDELFTNKLQTVSIETNKLYAKEGSRIGSLKVTENGNFLGANIQFDNCAGTGFIPGEGGPTDEYFYQNRIIDNIKSSSTFMLSSNDSKRFVLYLPDYEDIREKCFNGKTSDFIGLGFNLRFIAPPFWNTVAGLDPFENRATFRIQSKTYAQIFDNNANKLSYIDITRGDVLELYGLTRLYDGDVLGSNIKFGADYFIKSWRN